MIDDLEVNFPYDLVYKEQFEYMRELKNTLDNKVRHFIYSYGNGYRSAWLLN